MYILIDKGGKCNKRSLRWHKLKLLQDLKVFMNKALNEICTCDIGSQKRLEKHKISRKFLDKNKKVVINILHYI